jgi:hypothetical protein
LKFENLFPNALHQGRGWMFQIVVFVFLRFNVIAEQILSDGFMRDLSWYIIWEDLFVER